MLARQNFGFAPPPGMIGIGVDNDGQAFFDLPPGQFASSGPGFILNLDHQLDTHIECKLQPDQSWHCKERTPVFKRLSTWLVIGGLATAAVAGAAVAKVL